MPYVLVDDPAYKGPAPAPQILRTWAMRKLADSGMSTGDIARYYDVPFAAAYRAVNPERRPKDKSRSDPSLIKKMKTSELRKIVSRKGASMSNPRDAAAFAELERRDPRWDEK